jgi:hypothetical protein
MKRLLQFLISLFKTGGKTKNGSIIVKDLAYATKLKTISNWQYTDPVLYKTWQAFPKKQHVSYLRQIRQGKMTTQQLEKQIRAYEDMITPAKINFTVKHGIKFAENELSAINTTSEQIANMINNKENLAKYPKGFNITLPTEFTISRGITWDLPAILTAPKGTRKQIFPGATPFPKPDNAVTHQAKVTVRVVPYEYAKKIKPEITKTTGGWMTRENGTEFYLVWEHFTQEQLNGWTAQLADIKRIMTHEIAHIKDPSIVAAPKLQAKYSFNAPYVGDTKIALAKKAAPNWKKNYYYHQWEVAANLAPILAKITNNTKNILRSAGKKKTLAALDELTKWVAYGSDSHMWVVPGGGVKRYVLDPTATYILTGIPDKSPLYGNIETFFKKFKTENPTEHRKVLNKLARQIEALKQQVKDTKNLTPESVIKLNTKLGFTK